MFRLFIQNNQNAEIIKLTKIIFPSDEYHTCKTHYTRLLASNIMPYKRGFVPNIMSMKYLRLNTPLHSVLLTVAVMLLSILFNTATLKAEDGFEIFRRTCATCHTVGDGRLVGPDLANVHNRRDEDWIMKFVKSSQSVIKSGDEQAVKIFAEFNSIPMPDQPLSDAEISKVLAYIIENSPEETEETAEKVVIEPKNTLAGDKLMGQQNFGGLQRLTNGGPACNACHNVDYDAVMSGGLLAKDLTEAFSRLTGAGVSAILSNPPFPRMAQAYKGKSLTEQEVADLTAFLKEADEQHIYQHSRDYGKYLAWAGIPGALTLLVIFYLIWINRKSYTVNKDIYDRQMKS